MNTEENKLFYERLPLGELNERYAKYAHLETCIDLQEIWKRHASAKKITEVGAGEGRVIKWLLQNTNTEIVGVERCANFFKHLQRIFAHTKRVQLKFGDILHTTVPKSDLIILAWSFIMELKQRSQIPLIKRLQKCGTVVVDIPINPARTLQASVQDSRGNTITGIFPDETKLDQLCSQKHYYSAEGHRRIQYTFTATP